MKNKNLFVSVGVLIIGLLLSFFIWQFNESGKVLDKYLLGNIMLLFWIPVLTIFFVFWEDVKEFGFRMPENPKVIWSITGICMVDSYSYTVFYDIFECLKMPHPKKEDLHFLKRKAIRHKIAPSDFRQEFYPFFQRKKD